MLTLGQASSIRDMICRKGYVAALRMITPGAYVVPVLDPVACSSGSRKWVEYAEVEIKSLTEFHRFEQARN